MSVFDDISKQYEHVMPLTEIVQYLPDVTYNQLTRWAESKRNNGFPEAKEVVGRHKLYDLDEVIKWVVLWKKATKNLGRGKELNDG